MAIKQLQKPVTKEEEERATQFIAKGGSAKEDKAEIDEDHRLTLRIPKWLLEKIDQKRKQRVGTISRNLWILEQVDKAAQD